ncbi:MAG: hypothetical protein LLG04_04350 [Parachlamydia sp.]|nr:hypothetical protein [Parachlamydia sp.]
MSFPVKNRDTPSDSLPSVTPRNVSQAYTLAETIDGAKALLPEITAPGSLRSSALQRQPPAASLNVTRAVSASLSPPYASEPAPVILQNPATYILQILQQSLTQKKNVLPQPRWFFEYLVRHQEEFQEIRLLQQLFSNLGTAACQRWLPCPTSEEAETLSLLFCRLCRHTQNSAEFVRAFIGLSFLICRFQRSILNREAFPCFISTLKVLTTLQNQPVKDMNTLFQALTLLCKHFPFEYDPVLADFLAILLIDYHNKAQHASFHPSIQVMQIPGMLNSLLTQGEISADRRLALFRLLAHPGMVITASERQRLFQLFVERAPEDEDEADLEATPEVVAKIREARNKAQIINALLCVGTLAKNSQLAPIPEAEISLISLLLEQLLSCDPVAEEIENAFSAILMLVDMVPLDHLKALEAPLTNMLRYAAYDHDLMPCLRRETAGYRIMQAAATKRDWRLCQVIRLTLLERLKSVVHDEDDPCIGPAFYYAGLLADFPVKQDCSQEIISAFQELALKFHPSLSCEKLSLNDLISKLLCARKPIDNAWVAEFVPELIAGLGMMASNHVFTSFISTEGGKMLNDLLHCFCDLEPPEEMAEILFWMDKLVEMSESMPGLNSLLDGHQYQWIAWLLPRIPIDVSYEIRAKIIFGLGSLIAHHRITHLPLSPQGKKCLTMLVSTHFGSIYHQENQKPVDVSELLYLVAQLHLKGLIDRECPVLYKSLYVPFLLSVREKCRVLNIEQISKILFFIDSVEPLQASLKRCATLNKLEEDEMKLAAFIQELNSKREQYFLQTQLTGKGTFIPGKRRKSDANGK